MPDDSSASLAQILDAEILRVGTWNGHKFTEQDLLDIAANAAEVGYTPPLKKGHDDSVGARAWGWVHNIRAAGGKLLGDLMDVPEGMAEVIRERGYDQLSAEIVPNLVRGGRSFKKALWAVALLGAEIPAVSGLKPLHELPVFSAVKSTNLIFTDTYEGGLEMPDSIVSKESPPEPRLAPSPEEVARLRDEAAAMKAKADAQAAELAEQKAASEAQAQELATLKGQAEALVELKQRADNLTVELAQQREQTAALEAANREIALSAKLDAWKGPPGFRPYLDVLYRSAWEGNRTVKLSLDPAKPEEMSFEAAVDKLADKLAGDTSWMLKQLSVVGGTRQYDDPGAEVETRARKKMAADSSLNYMQAKERVFSEDEGLKKAYAGVP